MKRKERSKEWRKTFFALIRPIIRSVAYVFWGASTKVYREVKGPYLVLANHSSIADAMLVGAAFTEPVHVVSASATLQKSVLGKIVRFLADPIPVEKAGMDMQGIRRIFAEAKAGHSIALFPEGNITIDGSHLPIDRSVAKLARQLKLKIVMYRVEGGYLQKPKWALHARKGKVMGAVVDVIEAEQAAEMSIDELYSRILEGIAYDAEIPSSLAIKGKRLAEGIERLLYYCPSCGEMVGFESHGDNFKCPHCGQTYRVYADGRIEGGIADTIQWNAWQKEKLLSAADALRISIEGDMVEVTTGETVHGTMSLAPDGVTFGERTISMDTLDGVALHGSNHVLFTIQGGEFRFAPSDKHANVLPLVELLQTRLSA